MLSNYISFTKGGSCEPFLPMGWHQVSYHCIHTHTNKVSYIITSKMICHGGQAWVSLHNLLIQCFVMAMDNSRICSMSMVNKLRTATSLVKEATTATHTLRLNFTMKSWAESSELISVIMHGPYLKRVWQYRLWAACPCLSWYAVAFSRSIVVELDSEGSIVSTFSEH